MVADEQAAKAAPGAAFQPAGLALFSEAPGK